jgi:hypothetical protein
MLGDNSGTALSASTLHEKPWHLQDTKHVHRSHIELEHTELKTEDKSVADMHAVRKISFVNALVLLEFGWNTILLQRSAVILQPSIGSQYVWLKLSHSEKLIYQDLGLLPSELRPTKMSICGSFLVDGTFQVQLPEKGFNRLLYTHY